jgi:hypothetical protein
MVGLKGKPPAFFKRPGKWKVILTQATGAAPKIAVPPDGERAAPARRTFSRKAVSRPGAGASPGALNARECVINK